MKIESISRKITGRNYDNLSMTATLSEGEDPIKASVELDKKCNEALQATYNDMSVESEKSRKTTDMLVKLDKLKAAIRQMITGKLQ